MKLEQRTYALLISGILAIVLVALVSMVPAPYALMRPGPVKDVLSGKGKNQLIAISGRETFPTSGSLDLTTVQVSGGPGAGSTMWELLGALADPTADARPVDEVYPPDQTQEEIDEVNAAEMVSSQEAATAAALKELGIPITSSVTVARVPEDSGARGVLREGDVITSLDARPLTTAAEIRDQLVGVEPGQQVSVGLLRKGERLEATVVTSSTQDPGGGRRTILGVRPGVSYEFPFEVRISIDDIGGPSAGMIFSLGIIDKLTPGELVGEQRVAGTGTVDADGTVGAIGGIRQKVFAAHDAGATWFLVPASNCPEIHDVPDGITLVKVSTLHDAHQAAQAIGAGDQAATDALPRCTTDPN